MIEKAGFEPAASASRSQFWRILADPPEQIHQVRTSAWTLVNGIERSGARIFRGFASCMSLEWTNPNRMLFNPRFRCALSADCVSIPL